MGVESQQSPVLNNGDEKKKPNFVHIPIYDVQTSHKYPNSAEQVESDEQIVQIDERWYAKNENYKPLTADQRPGFIRKVYSIMILQLLLTVAACCLSYFWIPYRDFQNEYSGWVYLAIAVAIIIEIILLWIPKYSWRVPHNYLFVFVFTLAESYTISQLCSYVFNKYRFIVLMAAALTLAAVIGLTLYACKTKKDFTTKGAFLFMASTSLFLFAILSGVYYDQAMSLLYSLISSMLFGIYLIYDTQLIIGGSTHKLSIDDYIIGAMFIYIDIIYLFAHIVLIIIACFK
ncbi:unnamed protein product (macronuclear) [Paramecium tetraurelia]|uniref:Uncharacterized protein n=1 Tax=Paramecium tetraurelia TaxID=5888 RepID=A0CDY7_PARTE|nr:uncharacterized protein GSPATT00007216001 [Paramecium tetraurelia]CAK69004.1 unnamed protein product [Paramecium tetraurelia]|eukprot:XP_001436401.1 hypothetical protein (macronuclear) [Paramecium tetraurelia strain d4-2]